MSEQPPPDRPSQPPKPGTWDAASEQELDEALSKASSLASDLAEQLSAPEEHPAGDTGNPLEADRESLDQELNQLGDLVSTAAREIDESAANGEAGRSSGRHEVPDFMAEFMSPEPPAAAAAPTPAAVPAAATILDDLTASPVEAAASKAPTAIPGVVGGPINITIPTIGGHRSADSSTASVKSDPPNVEASEDGSSLGAFALAAHLLNVLDRPFSWAGPRLRLAAGIIGLLALGAAAVVFVSGGR